MNRDKRKKKRKGKLLSLVVSKFQEAFENEFSRLQNKKEKGKSYQYIRYKV